MTYYEAPQDPRIEQRTQIQVVQEKTPIQEVPEIMKLVAKCESNNSHYDDNGEVLRGRVDNRDTGKYQINLYYHQAQAEKMGLDLFKEKDNETYALYLYEKQGLAPWSASFPCIEKGGW